MAQFGDVLEEMRSEWNRRAKEDAFYYVAFAHRDQDTHTFNSTAALVLPILEAELVRLEGDRYSRRALEVGCGPGRLMLPLSRHFAEIHGVDVSDEMIARAESLLQEVSNAHVHLGNGCDLGMFPSEFFDFAYSFAVFQHIPSKEVILNYLREIQRVLKPKGVFRGQFYGRPKVEQVDTWSGCSVTGDELAEFAKSRGLQLLAISGEGTQYLWATLCKTDPSSPVNLACTSLLAVTAADGLSSVPQRGPRAGVSLWIAGLPDSCDLNDLTVGFDRVDVRGTYLGTVGSAGGHQLNALVPRGTHPGPTQVSLNYRGRLLSKATIEITPGPARDPQVGVAVDAVNLLSRFRIECGALRVGIEDVEDPKQVSFCIDGHAGTVIEFECTEAFLDNYDYVVRVPPAVEPGKRSMIVRLADRELPPVELDIV
jgi:SAM-dependent methyltransferase